MRVVKSDNVAGREETCFEDYDICCLECGFLIERVRYARWTETSFYELVRCGCIVVCVVRANVIADGGERKIR